MRKSDILTLADREAARLEAENDHSAAAIVRVLTDWIRDEKKSSVDTHVRNHRDAVCRGLL